MVEAQLSSQNSSRNGNHIRCSAVFGTLCWLIMLAGCSQAPVPSPTPAAPAQAQSAFTTMTIKQLKDTLKYLKTDPNMPPQARLATIATVKAQIALDEKRN